ncbi:MAG TPA: hypothetical protein VJZ00_13395 [Thermoanaerobaculia bacterium]|nr:hypothetical protein [Thermoanaerobaculia bacterium]
MIRKTLAMLAVVVCVACGKRGDPHPPVPAIPQATTDLAVTQRADRIVLTWSYPALTTAGRNLTDVRRIHVYRYVEELPVSAVTGEPKPLQPADPATPEAVTLFAKVPTLPKAQFEKLATRVETIEKANLASATAGARLLYTDAPPLRAQDGRPVRVTYAVVTESEATRSEASNLATLVPLAVAVAPASLSAAAKPQGIVLTWQEPKASVGGSGAPVITGYQIYRSAPGETVNELAMPINATPVKETTFTDTPAYGEHEYRVAAVATLGPPLVQSELSLPARAAFRDLVAPPVPTNVNALTEPKLVRLIWDAVDAPDLAGYRLYRTEGTGHDPIKPVGTIPLTNVIVTTTTYTDTGVNLGIAYRYGVASVDKTGNESEKTWTDWVIVPKTP